MELTLTQLEMIRAYEEISKAQEDFLTILPHDSIDAEIRRKLKIRCEKQIQNFMKYPGLTVPF
ncbi:hypothetical protein [Nitrosopumilus sp.]|uniref:hypothetical protein n=1 Tax=Nitrosopumilus sp. TaxID=2024843 RepID=UPI003D13267A